MGVRVLSSNGSNNKKVIFKEDSTTLESYINQIDQETKEMNCLTELYLIELCGILNILRALSKRWSLDILELLGYKSGL